MTFPIVPLLYRYCPVCKKATTAQHAIQHEREAKR